MNALRPHYPNEKIRSKAALCRALGVSENELLKIIRRIPSLYIGPTQKLKKNGIDYRYVYDTKEPLKSLLQRINSEIFKKVKFPPYITGAVRGSDYVVNVGRHSGSSMVFCEDIASFFDNITAGHVYRIWRGFFGFSDDVAEILTALTTKDGHVYQGTPTSSYLANLAFWEVEAALVTRLHQRGFTYSRFVDDIAASTKAACTAEDKTWVIGQIYGLMASQQFQPKRKKHEILKAGKPIVMMGLNANRKPSLSARERAAIRAQVYQLEVRAAQDGVDPDLPLLLRKAGGRVGRLSRLHPTEGQKLRTRIAAIRERLPL